MALQYRGGDLLASTVEAVVNTVNTRGVMGKGIALQVKQRWPEVDRVYRAASRRGEVTLGRMHVVERGDWAMARDSSSTSPRKTTGDRAPG